MENRIALTNEDGTMKTKEEFLDEMTELYDSLNEVEKCHEISPIYTACTQAECQIDPVAAMNTYNFIDKAITIRDVITDDTAKTVIDQIRFWNAVDLDDDNPDPIVLYIDSDGGSLTATLSIIGAIETSRTPVYTVNLGKAYSGGFFILVAGHKRYALPYSSYMFHEGSTMVGGDAHKVIQSVSFYRRQLETLRNFVLENTNISEETYELYKKDDWWLDNEGALKYGVIDEEIDDITIFEKNEEEDN